MATPVEGRDRFPGYDVVSQSPVWDKVTARVVLSRLDPAPPLRFFTSEEEPTARSLVSRLLALEDGPEVPVLEIIDQRLYDRAGDGYRHEDLPEDPEAWRDSVAGLDADAMKALGGRFWEVHQHDQARLIEEVRLNEGTWNGMPAAKLFALWMRYSCSAFYSHPLVWNEIGFGGPAYPRGYKNLGFGKREPWEVAERGAQDPIAWVDRAEAARRRHTRSLSKGRPTPS